MSFCVSFSHPGYYPHRKKINHLLWISEEKKEAEKEEPEEEDLYRMGTVAVIMRMLKLPEDERNRYDRSSLEIAIHAAAPCPVLRTSPPW